MSSLASHSGPVHDAQRALGAKFGDFAGWSMPLEYANGGIDGVGGVLAEHEAVRERVGLFDVSHMGTFVVRGDGAKDELNQILTNDLAKIGPGQAQYSLLCNDSGGVIDDVLLYLRSDSEVLIVPNAANAAMVTGTVERVLESSDVRLVDQQHQTAIFAIQGPLASDVLADIGLPGDVGYLRFSDVETDHGSVLVARTGYTGERGYELLIPVAHASFWWDEILAAVRSHGGLPCGLGARDTLRTEMGYPLHGHELTSTVNPVEAGLSWAVGWDKTAFPGRRALVEAREQASQSRRLVGVRCIDRAIPRPGMTVRAAGEQVRVLGVTTSGTFSPTLKAGIALAFLDDAVQSGDEVALDVRGRSCRAQVVEIPFVTASPR
ncbi:MAG: aminomethyltransferase [Actinomycetes bacterium]|jgi:aminomethyltransferase